ncbi:hypothetical protein ACOSP7_027846 [Xanthoceras sorbifolium]|uniref:Uncharacterized protein n=1 Tax=Xanthoceras sorbifolium TaxID=99658 RepID=A0ABQ8HDT4_9ROSI|nr:hypothetical protein JRO89_XS12G0249700 [Xanthoceras sorbifolium]
MMSKIHPSTSSGSKGGDNNNMLLREKEEDMRPCMLTVWKRSSMSFQGTDGFTVFDNQGRLVFRVDNYSRNSRRVAAAGLLLMDGAGNALLSLKPQILSMQYQWNGYREESDRCGKRGMSKAFTMRSSSLLFHSGKDEAKVFMMGSGPTRRKQAHQTPDFKIEGCFRSRNCKIKNANGDLVAQIARKRANSTILLSDDVFSLLVYPGFGTDLVMAFVVILDRISSKPYTPVLCS